ncbi:MAG: hypothetical protein JRM82_01410, partial [Nitrososphaerota archaeon]|nr:hypothetical protein [Nitrososphaerota archaeon]
SSGVEEDLPGVSFAGQYETVLGVQGLGPLETAVRRCWASAFGPRVLEYRRSRGMEGVAPMAVVVQRMIRADSAGVAFTANPVTGDRREVLVNAVRGLGERLVSGAASADEWSVKDEHAELVRTFEKAITAEQAREVARLARKAEAHFGVPQDIEWAYSAGRLYILQARPITALPENVEWKAPPGAWMRNFRLGEWLGEPLTPLFESWLLERLEERLFSRLERVMGIPAPRPYHATVNGWYFANMNFLPTSRPRLAVAGLRYFLPGFILRPRAMSLLTTRFAGWGLKRFEREWREVEGPAYRRSVERAKARLDVARPDELVEMIDQLAEAAGDYAYSMIAVGGSVWKVEYQLAAFYNKNVSKKMGGSYQALLQGGGSAATQAPGVTSLDWVNPTLDELGISRSDTKDSAKKALANQERVKAESQVWETLRSSPRLLKKFNHILSDAQHFADAREEQAAEFTLAWPIMRKAVLDIGQHLVGEGVLRSPDDVFFLTRDELVSGLRGSVDLSSLARERRKEWQWQRRLSPPLQLGKMPAIAQRILRGFEGVLSGQRSDEAAVKGMPASPGRTTGIVRIIRSAQEFDSLQEGEILVAPMTTPSWTPLFARAAAVVTDTGSLMAHASLVAREYGIPAVVGTGNGTVRLRDGMLVTVDGTAGVVNVEEGVGVSS